MIEDLRRFPHFCLGVASVNQVAMATPLARSTPYPSVREKLSKYLKRVKS